MAPLSGPILTAEQMRAAEANAGVPLSELMDRAGAAVAEAVWRFGGGQRTLILCGPGNNGGDGYVAARLLKARGIDVTVAALREPRAELAIGARKIWDGPILSLAEAKPAPVLVDALFGTGLARPLEDEVRTPVSALAARARFLLAVDVPSGLGTDDGADLGATAADLTLALGALKPSHLLQPGASLCGRVHVADIGICADSDVEVLQRPKLSAPEAGDHKYSRGYAAIVGGAMAGAAMLAARAALPIAGYVGIAGARRTGPDALVHKRWDDVATDTRIGAILIGPGLGRDDAAREKLAAALALDASLVLDGDAFMLATTGEIVARGAPTVLTPHDGEFASLFGSDSGSRIDRARTAAARSGAVVVLKGANSIVAAPDGRVRISPTAPSWLASAGTGDVLAGLCVAAVARSSDPFEAACQAVWLHGEAGRLAGPALTADDLPRYIPAAIAACL